MAQEFDCIVIGAGCGGIAAAGHATRFGVSVLLIEGKDFGGIDLNCGGIQMKNLWHAAQIAESFNLATDYGFARSSVPKWSWSDLRSRRQAATLRDRQQELNMLIQRGVTYMRGVAHFVEPKVVEVNGQRFTAEHIVIASGTSPITPDLPGASLGIDSDSFFDLPELPKSVAIVGAGYVAVEYALTLSRLGCQVKLLTRKDRVLRRFDPMIQDAVNEILLHQPNLEYCPNVQVTRVAKSANGVEIELKSGKVVSSDLVIWAIGRKANVKSLNLGTAHIQLDEHGFIPTDKLQNTAAKGIYAIGDVTGRRALMPVAVAAGRALSERLFHKNPEAAVDYGMIPTVIFAHPPIASLGLTEPQVMAKFGEDNLRVYNGHATPSLYELSLEPPQIRVKLICLGKEKRVIGLHAIGYGMEEVVQGFALAIKMGATKADFERAIAVHPTSAEIFLHLR